MIYVCVPVHNEARTVGLVLWRVRQVFSAFAREYQLLVCDDGSTDDTAAVLAAYARVLPMTVTTNPERRGYGPSLEGLLRLALQGTDRPKRDCAITLHADFLHSPDAMDEMVKRVESGADLVVGELLQAAGNAPMIDHGASPGMPVRQTISLLPRNLLGRKVPVVGFLELFLGFAKGFPLLERLGVELYILKACEL